MRTNKTIVLSLMLLIGLLLAIVPASASTVTVQFLGMSGANQNGEYTYPYYLTINGGPPMWMMCDDFYDRIGVGDSWQANITQLSSSDVSLTRFGDLEKYQEAAYLLLQTRITDPSEWGNINWAIWDIFDPSADPGPYLPGVEYWLNQAETVDLSTIDFSGVRIVTPIGDHGQEFLFMTPEPGTLLLLGSGLLGFWARRKRHQA